MHYLILAAALLLGAPAFATGTWDRNCASGFTGAVLSGGSEVLGTSTNGSKNIGAGQLGCYRFTDASTTGFSSDQTPLEGDGDIVIHITAESAFWIFAPSLTAPTTASGVGKVKIRYCASGTPLIDRDNPDDECPALVELNGVELGSGLSTRTGPGVYVIEISEACAASVTCQVSVRGEGLGQ
jgi:hypothetical protein